MLFAPSMWSQYTTQSMPQHFVLKKLFVGEKIKLINSSLIIDEKKCNNK